MALTAFADTLADNDNSYPRAATVAPSASRTTAQDFGDSETRGAGGLGVIVEVTAWTAGSITVTVQGVTPTGAVYPLLVSAAIAATGITRLRVSPSLLAVANQVANDLVPDRIRIHVAVADATPITYSISAFLTPEG